MRMPARIADLLMSNNLDLERPLLRKAQTAWNRNETLIILSGQTQSGKSTAAGWLAANARSPGRKITAMVNCYEGDDGAYKACVDGVWYGYWVRDEVVEVGSHPLDGLWIHAPSAFDNIFQPAFWKKNENSGVMVLDDLGLEPGDERVKARIIGLLVTRFDGNARTIITTNLDRVQFQAQYCAGAGKRISARLGHGWINAMAPVLALELQP
jgi:hypothetical protein